MRGKVFHIRLGVKTHYYSGNLYKRQTYENAHHDIRNRKHDKRERERNGDYNEVYAKEFKHVAYAHHLPHAHFFAPVHEICFQKRNQSEHEHGEHARYNAAYRVYGFYPHGEL